MFHTLLLLELLGFWALFAGLASALTVTSTILVFARDTASSVSATSGLNGYGIPFQVVLVPSTGITLPVLNSSSTEANYGGIIVVGEVGYDYSDGWRSAITPAQWQTLYTYQTTFGVRMVRLDVFPSQEFGVRTAIDGAGCCDPGVEQLVSFTDISGFRTANLRSGAGVTTQDLWHYPATITNATTTKQIAKFGPGGPFTSDTTAAVINTIGNRQQMVWFIGWATEWSFTSNFLMHAHIHWMTRGLFIGRRRIYFSAQVDDMLLATGLYEPAGVTFRARVSDLNTHVTWQTNLNNRLPSGSTFFLEIGYNGNGNVEWAVNNDPTDTCRPDMVQTTSAPDPPLEFQKPLGTGTDRWPTTPASYAWTTNCISKDELASWFMVSRNRDRFAHVSHTFTHLNLNNVTYSDANKEIGFNQAWFRQSSLASGSRFSSQGLIPPAITGLHNGDAIRAFIDNGLRYVVGDNSRPRLLNEQNPYWPLITNVADNGYAGLVIMPRWASPIYYNCDTPSCTTKEWIETSGGSGDFNSLLDFSRATYGRHLLALRQDPFMFHQANLRTGDVPNFTVGGQSGRLSLIQIFVEVLLQEMMRLTTWPIVTLKHDDIGAQFVNRMTQDACKPNLSYTVTNRRITSVTVTANGNTCSVPIPVTFPVTPLTLGLTTRSEKLGTDPLTLWTTLSGRATTFTLLDTIDI